ncbi:MAG: hypothetical protein HKN91_12550 [Acidimicrobiia bacterium]|nr:hypothetical protein [Acidimicrobiia bacterium]
MRPSVASVISPRPWEKRLADAAAESGLVRLVARCYNPGDLPAGVEVIVAGTETPWLNARLIASWRRRGVAVIGVFPAPDRAAVALLCRAEVDQLFVETVDPALILRTARDLANIPGRATASGSAGDRVVRRRVRPRRELGREAYG